MGFFDTYEDTGGSSYVGKAEKEELIAGRIPFDITGVFKRPSKFEEGEEQYVVKVTLAGEDRALTFSAGTVESRDRMLDAAASFLDGVDGEPITVVLVRKGRSLILEDPATVDA